MNFILAFFLIFGSFKQIKVRYIYRNGVYFVSAKEVANKFRLGFREGSKTYALVAPSGRILSIAKAKNSATVRGEVHTFPKSYKRKEGKRLYLAADLWAELLSPLLDKNIYWDAERRKFFIVRYEPSIKRMWIRHPNDTTYITFYHEEGVRARIERSGNILTVYFKRGFYRGPCYVEGNNITYRRVKVQHTQSGTKFRITLKRGVDYIIHTHSDSTVVKLFPSGTVVSGSSSIKFKRERRIQTVVIDPGHGGQHPGAIGPDGTPEKDIVLQIALKLKRILEKEMGLKVYLTRDSDRDVGLLDRINIARSKNADLFISIHCNSSKRRKVRGTETYFLSVAGTDWERAVEAAENMDFSNFLDGNPDNSDTDILEMVLADMAQTEFLKESESLAEFIQEGIVRRTRFHNRGVKQANFLVLKGVSYMPSVLVEVGFISNPKEERLLKKSSVQEKIARGIADGIKKFKSIYEASR